MSLVIQENIQLAAHTTLQIGGFARYFAEVENINDVIEAGKFARVNNLPVLLLGGGSNVLVSDEGFAGLVVKNLIKGYAIEEVDNELLFEGGAGELLDEVIDRLVADGYSGLENLSSIPGTLGATPVQNVGAYGVEIGDLIKSVRTINLQTGEEKIFSQTECEFGYRDSFFKSSEGKKYFITHVVIKIKKIFTPKIAYADLQKIFLNQEPTLIGVREAVIKVRAGKFPDWKVLGTAGSFFKNPVITKIQFSELLLKYPDLPHYAAGEDMVKIPLGYVLDKLCGLKGYREGVVGLYEAQALVLVNYGGASAKEVKSFVDKIKKIVFEKTKIKIEPEVNFI